MEPTTKLMPPVTVTAFVSAEGGTGRTSAVVAMASRLVLRRPRALVVCVDLDQKGDLTRELVGPERLEWRNQRIRDVCHHLEDPERLVSRPQQAGRVYAWNRSLERTKRSHDGHVPRTASAWMEGACESTPARMDVGDYLVPTAHRNLKVVPNNTTPLDQPISAPCAWMQRSSKMMVRWALTVHRLVGALGSWAADHHSGSDEVVVLIDCPAAAANMALALPVLLACDRLVVCRDAGSPVRSTDLFLERVRNPSLGARDNAEVTAARFMLAARCESVAGIRPTLVADATVNVRAPHASVPALDTRPNSVYLTDRDAAEWDRLFAVLEDVMGAAVLAGGRRKRPRRTQHLSTFSREELDATEHVVTIGPPPASLFDDTFDDGSDEQEAAPGREDDHAAAAVA